MQAEIFELATMSAQNTMASAAPQRLLLAPVRSFLIRSMA